MSRFWNSKLDIYGKNVLISITEEVCLCCLVCRVPGSVFVDS